MPSGAGQRSQPLCSSRVAPLCLIWMQFLTKIQGHAYTKVDDVNWLSQVNQMVCRESATSGRRLRQGSNNTGLGIRIKMRTQRGRLWAGVRVRQRMDTAVADLLCKSGQVP